MTSTDNGTVDGIRVKMGHAHVALCRGMDQCSGRNLEADSVIGVWNTDGTRDRLPEVIYIKCHLALNEKCDIRPGPRKARTYD